MRLIGICITRLYEMAKWLVRRARCWMDGSHTAVICCRHACWFKP